MPIEEVALVDIKITTEIAIEMTTIVTETTTVETMQEWVIIDFQIEAHKEAVEVVLPVNQHADETMLVSEAIDFQVEALLVHTNLAQEAYI